MSIKPTNIPKCHLRKSADSAGNISRHCKLGEVTENIRTFAPPFENQAYTFNMYFEYDSWNRIQIITYPDGEKVSYDYNLGGMPDRVTGDKGSEHNVYVHHIEYNPFEQKEAVFYGNGTRAYYKYDVLLRLSHLRSVSADGTMQDIDYDYDEVSNINSIENLAGVLPNNLGGTYRSDYTYDNLYRLTYADGNWHGNNTLYYETSIEYEKNGRISRKVLYADTWLDGNYATENYDNRYYYANSSQPNTLSYINDNPDQHFDWDLKGNMVFHYNGYSDYNRSLCWDEQNRLLGVKDDKQRLSYYLYDANGDRTYKFTGEYAAQNQSGQWHYYYLLNSPTLYASPYLVTNKKGYTKHYYAESERIASRIGGGGLQDLHKGFENYPDMVGKHKKSSANLFGKVMECLDADALPQKDALKYLYEWQEVVEDEKDCYWYHPDHLGSSSWITYSDGSAVQHLHYLPWGEDFVDQRSTTWNAMYTFSAKEKDTETGYSYFGSRYYNSDLSIWLSVDPMSDKYASLSPYVYCADNPVKLVDPNGEWPEDRAKRFMKRHEYTHVYREKDGSISVQYSKPDDKKSIGVVIRLKKFKMNFFERIISKIQRPNENINKRHSHRGGIWGTTDDPAACPPGQDESTDAQVEQTNLDQLQQFSVPKSHHFIEDSFNYNSQETDNNGDEKSVSGTSGEFIIFFNQKQDDGAVARGVPYNGTEDSIRKRQEIESNGETISRVDVNK